MYSQSDGVVLGPFEALLAELMWFREVAHKVPLKDLNEMLPGLRQTELPSVPADQQRRILDASILYGLPDTTALGATGPNLLEDYLEDRGISVSYRVWVEEVLPEYGFKRTLLRRREAFAETAQEWATHLRSVDETVKAARENDFATTPAPVIRTVIRVLDAIGYKRISVGDEAPTNLATYAQLLLGDAPWPDHGVRFLKDGQAVFLPGPIRARAIANGIYDSITKSITSSAPFLSSDALGPAWISQGGDEPQYQLIKAIFDLPDGPRRPDTFQRIQELEGDRKLRSLREYVDFAMNRVLTADANAIAEVKREAAAVVRSRRLSHRLETVAQAVTYIAVPVGIAEAYADVVGPGIAISVLGALGQGMASTLNRRNTNHWTSI